ncbi:MAG TPA: phage late control D family protein, partial [Nannocystis sp.]
MSISDTIAEFAQDLLPTVQYGFTSKDTSDVHWQVRRFSLHESLSAPYRLEIELWTEDLGVQPTGLLGDSCTLTIERDGKGRRVHGIIHHVDMLPAVLERMRVRVVAAPALHLLTYQRNTRFWQEKTALEILDEVLGPAL